MDSRTRRLLAMAKRILDFVHAQPASTDPGYQALVAELEALVARGDELARQQRLGTLAQSAAVQRRFALRTRMARTQVRYLVRVARRAAKTDQVFAAQFVMPPTGSPLKDFVTAARAMVELAIPRKDLLVSLGLSATLLDELGSALDSFDAATVQAHDGQRGHIDARSELNTLGRRILEVANALDGWFSVIFADTPESLDSWHAARNVIGPFTHQAPVTPPPPEPAPGDRGEKGGTPEAP